MLSLTLCLPRVQQSAEISRHLSGFHVFRRSCLLWRRLALSQTSIFVGFGTQPDGFITIQFFNHISEAEEEDFRLRYDRVEVDLTRGKEGVSYIAGQTIVVANPR